MKIEYRMDVPAKFPLEVRVTIENRNDWEDFGKFVDEKGIKDGKIAKLESNLKNHE